MINRLVEPSSGRIRLTAKPTEQMDIVQLCAAVLAMSFQNAGLFPKNIIDNIATTAILNGAAKSKARARAGNYWRSSVWIRKSAKRFPAAFREASSSGGRCLRSGGRPEFMLMDEPFSAVDPVVREQLQEEFCVFRKGEQNHHYGHHDIDEAMKLGDPSQFKPAASWRRWPLRANCSIRRKTPLWRTLSAKTEELSQTGVSTPPTQKPKVTQRKPYAELDCSFEQAKEMAIDRWLLVSPKTAKRLAGSTPTSRQQRLPYDNINLGATFHQQEARCAICWTLR